MSYLACDLPFGYKTNAVNLTFVAYENSTIRCGYLVYNDGMFLPAYSETAAVTVFPNGYILTDITMLHACVVWGGLKHMS